MTRETRTAQEQARVLLVMVHAPYNKTTDIESYYDEFVHLAASNGVNFVDTIDFKLREITSGTFLTKGHLEALAERCDQMDIDEIIISEPLSPQQSRNLSNYLNRPVFDRTELILEIFEKSAHTAEGKMQVAIAMLQNKKSHLAGKGIELAQQKGTIGQLAGGGETQKERETRHIDQLIAYHKKQLEKLHKVRETQRKQRLTSRVPHICIIGYTNAGKSTILNQLTHSNVLAEDRLFATLDTTTRELFINHKKIGVISDTVGFIQLLPPKLIDAFKSTLSELNYADLLLHVIDLSNPNWESHMKVVHEILKDLDVHKEMLFVFNKVDQVDMTEPLKKQLMKYHPQVLISAQSKEGIQPLVDELADWKPSSHT